MSSDFLLGLQGSFPVWGQAAPHGITIGGQLQFKWTSKSTRTVAPPTQDGFVTYGLEGKVTQVNEAVNLLRINKGKNEGVAAGQIFDIFLIKPDGELGEAVARAQCKHASADEATLSITEYFREVWIEEGFVVKRPIR